MPKVPIDFSKTLIYKIEHNDIDSLLYVGFTTNWDRRKCKHISDCKSKQTKLYQMIRENGGWEAFKMIEVEKYPCNDRREAEKRETEVMKELKSSMNTMAKSFLSDEEKQKYQKEFQKVYYELNKDSIKKKVKEYSLDNKDKISEKNKNYRELNKDGIKVYLKEYREANKEKRKEYVLLNKDQINQKHKQYCELNKDAIKEKRREYKIINKDIIKEKRRARYLNEKKQLKNNSQ